MQPGTFVDRLARASFGDACNFYRVGDGAPKRRARLLRFLEERLDAPLVLVGEAAGYRGARVSGIPFTSERQLTGTGPAEATATIVHRVLDELGLEGQTLLWNAVPAHPHLSGRPFSNRRPTRAEVEGGRPFLREIVRGRRVVAVGRVAGEALGLPWIRHPARGGGPAFSRGLLESGVGGRLVRRFSVSDEDLERETG